MNWEAIGASGEVVGAIAVILTLLYLAIQIRQNTRAVDETRKAAVAQMYLKASQLRIDVQKNLTNNERLLEI